VTHGNRRRSRTAKSTESVVLTVNRPGTGRNVKELDELPVTEIDVVERQIFANGRRHVQTGVLVFVRSWAFFTEHILPVVRLERADIFPLRVTNLVAVPDRYPTALADGLTIPHKGSFEPGNYRCCFRFSMMIIDIVVWKRDVEWI
jgi:hypothetical protein